MGAHKKPSTKSLSSGRPPTIKSSRSMSRKASRKLISKHHDLEKQRRQAFEKGNRVAEASITAEIAGLGGLDHYQQASLQGQSNDRGGDTSKVLMEWLPLAEMRTWDRTPRMLEVGALSTRNMCSASGIFDMVRIDLNSQEAGIHQQDFMERPLPVDDAEKFNMISLSLVLNFVPDPAGRGDMLLRTLSFLRSPTDALPEDSCVPSLFLVLPRSCLDNSRYFTDLRLRELMKMLGYAQIRSKTTQKLAYSLWRRVSATITANAAMGKKQINPGRNRNNFVVTLKESSAKPP